MLHRRFRFDKLKSERVNVRVSRREGRGEEGEKMNPEKGDEM